MSNTKDHRNVTDKWFNYVTTGRGPAAMRNGEYSYDGDTLFHNNVPWQRLLSCDDGRWVKLSKNSDPLNDYVYSNPDIDIVTILTPCIGTFTMFPGDRMLGKELTDRLRYVMTCQLRHLTVELIPRDSRGLQLSAMVHAKGSMYPPAGSLEKWRRLIEKYYARYDLLRTMLAPDWPPLPDFYLNDAMALMQKKVDDYLDPKAVAQRERAVARKLAVKVLDDN